MPGNRRREDEPDQKYRGVEWVSRGVAVAIILDAAYCEYVEWNVVYGLVALALSFTLIRRVRRRSPQWGIGGPVLQRMVTTALAVYLAVEWHVSLP
jgi:hypothetical protein